LPRDMVVGDVDDLVVVPQSVEVKVLEIAFKTV
jgi:regulator of RNase E activity RraA